MTLFGSLFQRGAVNDLGTNGAPTTLTPINDIVTSNWYWGAGVDTQPGLDGLYGSVGASYEEIVRRQLWVRIAVNKLAYGIGRLPLKTYALDADGNRERARDSVLAELLRRPNESKQTGHTAGFLARLVYDLMTFGNAVIVKSARRPDMAPDQLSPVSPRGWSVRNDGNYLYRDPLNGHETTYQPWQVIHIMEPGPTLYGMGVSRLEAARFTLAIEHAAQMLGAATFANGARPGGIINVKDLPAGAEQKAQAIERFKSEIQRRFGGPSKAGLPAVLEGNVSWMAMSHNLDDSAVVSHRKLTREEVAALYDIPQPAIGILDEANFASIDVLHLMLYQDTMGWPIALIEAALQRQLIDDVPDFAGQFVEFDMNAVMRGSFLQRMQGYQIAINGRVMTPQEARERENLRDMTAEQPEAGLLQFPLNFSVSPEAAGQGQDGPPAQQPAARGFAFSSNGHGAAHE